MTDKLISLQAAIDAILGQPPEPHYPSWYAEQIKALPPAQPEIVRCKDCKHWDEITNMCGKTQRMALGVNGFCSRGERKTDEKQT